METLIEDKIVIAESLMGCQTGVCEVNTSHEPYEGMVFESERAAKAFYDEYARREGFLARIVSSWKSECDGSVISSRLACNKEGFNLNSKKTGRVQIRYCYDDFKLEMGGITLPPKSTFKSQDEKDRRIHELSSELYRTKQQLAVCQEQLRAFMSYIEEHTECLSRTVEGVVHNIREVESKNKSHCRTRHPL